MNPKEFLDWNMYANSARDGMSSDKAIAWAILAVAYELAKLVKALVELRRKGLSVTTSREGDF